MAEPAADRHWIWRVSGAQLVALLGSVLAALLFTAVAAGIVLALVELRVECHRWLEENGPGSCSTPGNPWWRSADDYTGWLAAAVAGIGLSLAGVLLGCRSIRRTVVDRAPQEPRPVRA